MQTALEPDPCRPTSGPVRDTAAMRAASRRRSASAWDIDARRASAAASSTSPQTFLPDGLSKVDELDVPRAGRRAPPPEPGAGPHLRLHLRAGRALHQRQDARAAAATTGSATRPRSRRWCASATRSSSTRSCSAASRTMIAARDAAGLLRRWPTRTTSRAPCSRKSTWAVLALTCHIELFTQSHYDQSIAPRRRTSRRCGRTCSCIHWKEECQHAMLDELEWAARGRAARRCGSATRRSTT